jgi:hypothetical protein
MHYSGHFLYIRAAHVHLPLVERRLEIRDQAKVSGGQATKEVAAIELASRSGTTGGLTDRAVVG